MKLVILSKPARLAKSRLLSVRTNYSCTVMYRVKVIVYPSFLQFQAPEGNNLNTR